VAEKVKNEATSHQRGFIPFPGERWLLARSVAGVAAAFAAATSVVVVLHALSSV